jgi:hypothetical protein
MRNTGVGGFPDGSPGRRRKGGWHGHRDPGGTCSPARPGRDRTSGRHPPRRHHPETLSRRSNRPRPERSAATKNILRTLHSTACACHARDGRRRGELGDLHRERGPRRAVPRQASVGAARATKGLASAPAVGAAAGQATVLLVQAPGSGKRGENVAEVPDDLRACGSSVRVDRHRPAGLPAS